MKNFKKNYLKISILFLILFIFFILIFIYKNTIKETFLEITFFFFFEGNSILIKKDNKETFLIDSFRDNYDIYKLTAQTADITSFTTNLTGTPADGDILEIQITGTATRAITWGSSFVSSTVTLPTTTVGTATLTVVFQYYTTSSYGNNKWVCVNYY